MCNVQCVSLSGLHELGCATKAAFPTLPVVQTNVPLLMPVPVWEACHLSFSVSLHQLSKLGALSVLLVPYAYIYFSTYYIMLTLNFFYLIPYKPAHFLKLVFNFIYPSAKYYAWYKTDAQYMFMEVS